MSLEQFCDYRQKVSDEMLDGSLDLGPALLTIIEYCSCWDSSAFSVFRDYLRFLKSNSNEEISPDLRMEENAARWTLCENPHISGLSYILDGFLSSFNIVEHGISARWSRLTPLGEKVLELLETVEDFDGLQR